MCLGLVFKTSNEKCRGKLTYISDKSFTFKTCNLHFKNKIGYLSSNFGVRKIH